MKELFVLSQSKDHFSSVSEFKAFIIALFYIIVIDLILDNLYHAIRPSLKLYHEHKPILNLDNIPECCSLLALVFILFLYYNV